MSERHLVKREREGESERTGRQREIERETVCVFVCLSIDNVRFNSYCLALLLT